MEFTLNIESNIDELLKRTSALFYSQVPFALAVSINDTLFDMRRVVVDTTWQRAFTVRNKVLPKAMFKIDKISVGGPNSNLRAFKSGAADYMMGRLYQRAMPSKSGDIMASWPTLHALGGTKTPHRGRSIAVAKDPEMLRSPTGRIRKPNLPENITNKRKHFMIKRGGRPHLILKRVGDQKDVIYNFTETAKIEKSFRFFEDATMVFERSYERKFENAFMEAVKSSKFYRRG